MLGALIVWWSASFWLQLTMPEGTVHDGSPAQFPTQTRLGINKKRKMYAIKQIKICAEYRDMLPRPRLDLSGTPGLRPIGLSPGSWQTSTGLGSMSRYSAQILICITQYPIKLNLWWLALPSQSELCELNPSHERHITSPLASGPNYIRPYRLEITNWSLCLISKRVIMYDYICYQKLKKKLTELYTWD